MDHQIKEEFIMQNDSQKESESLDLSINKIDLSSVILLYESSKSHGH
ncbi:TPA: hypothetical protein TUL06_000010 [Streptococcus equi subsp. zooepidemicus]|nr:hypothetical protein [Streptococcus equi]HEL1015591.1 hypothetical protein [Streptococcus equi subsp. ruminatorum]MCD3381863.1 hypothetical protein [Streptococcus equi subsp. zooepidemicus]MCD3390701.1 hypothetical protein [Streptococcus equi subsp. zooepidemicus]MCD3398691.1 hypothetical protein [Streptococcus equi subsp. zooepidemicus]MCD3400671.1 hypothetical protein [Streptococcus equi subsp. zooepidemicus]